MQTFLHELVEEKGGEIYAVGPDTTVAGAVSQMNAVRIGAVMVLDGGRLVGMFTERDVLTKVIGQGIDPETTPVSEVMTRPVVKVKSTASVEEAMRIVTARRFRHLPVYEGDRLLGMVSSGDLTRWMVRHQQDTIDDLIHYIHG